MRNVTSSNARVLTSAHVLKCSTCSNGQMLNLLKCSKCSKRLRRIRRLTSALLLRTRTRCIGWEERHVPKPEKGDATFVVNVKAVVLDGTPDVGLRTPRPAHKRCLVHRHLSAPTQATPEWDTPFINFCFHLCVFCHVTVTWELDNELPFE